MVVEGMRIFVTVGGCIMWANGALRQGQTTRRVESRMKCLALYPSNLSNHNILIMRER